MRRSIVLVLAMLGTIGVVSNAAASASPGDRGLAPDKTVSPTSAPAGAPAAAPASTVPPLGGVPAQPTVAPPTSAWLATTAPPTVLLPPPTLPPTLPTVGPNTATTTSTATSAAQFDGLKFFTEVYAAVNGDPLALLDIAGSNVVFNSPADLFLAHLLTVSMTNRFYNGPTPLYTVAAAGKGVSVCTDTGACNTLGDFAAPTGLLESFTLNGVAIEDAVSGSTRRVVVESLSVDSILCLQSTDGTLSCAALMTSEGASVALSCDRAVFTGNDGQQFTPDLELSVFARSITDGDFGSAHLVFHGAPLEGQLTIPVVSGVSGVEAIVTVPVSAL